MVDFKKLDEYFAKTKDQIELEKKANE